MNARRTVAALAGALAALLCAAHAFAAAPEDRIKLAFTYNIARFVSWPERDTVAAPSFRLCVMGRDAYRIAAENLADRRIGNLPIEVVPIDTPADAALRCDLLYLPGIFEDARDYLDEVSAMPVLTVSDTPGFADDGGMIELARRNDRVAMRINVEASRRAGLSISSQLLSLATLVANDAEGDG